MPWISNNNYLGMEDMQNNAKMFYSRMIGQGWTLQSICGMLGNIQTESSINPGLWEGQQEGDFNVGFGLVQWTPARKYTDWAGSDFRNGDLQCDRINYEVENNIQWISTSTFPMTFQEFKVSTLSPYELAMVFIRNYERPFNPNQPIRGVQANYWYEYLSGEPPIPPSNQRKMPLMFYLKKRRKVL